MQCETFIDMHASITPQFPPQGCGYKISYTYAQTASANCIQWQLPTDWQHYHNLCAQPSDVCTICTAQARLLRESHGRKSVLSRSIPNPMPKHLGAWVNHEGGVSWLALWQPTSSTSGWEPYEMVVSDRHSTLTHKTALQPSLPPFLVSHRPPTRCPHSHSLEACIHEIQSKCVRPQEHRMLVSSSSF